MNNESRIRVRVRNVTGDLNKEKWDWLAVEEPLEIRLTYGPVTHRMTKSVSITMRTPAHDEELALGFLCTEGLIVSRNCIQSVTLPHVSDCGRSNTVTVSLQPHVAFDLKSLERHFYTTSSCGVCGKTSLEALQLNGNPTISLPSPIIEADLIHRLPEAIREAQTLFESTGGLHAAALFNAQGHLIALREDVGRHNALDKLIGLGIKKDWIPLQDHILLLSGRASFELMQKALRAGIAVVAAVGAPSSLAVQTAQQYNMTLVGFVRDSRFNIYTGEQRIKCKVPASVNTNRG